MAWAANFTAHSLNCFNTLPPSHSILLATSMSGFPLTYVSDMLLSREKAAEADNMTKEGQVPVNYKNPPFSLFSRGKKEKQMNVFRTWHHISSGWYHLMKKNLKLWEFQTTEDLCSVRKASINDSGALPTGWAHCPALSACWHAG